MKVIKAIKTYFEAQPHGRKISMDELKVLTPEDRQWLGRAACEEIGEEFEPSA